MARKRKSVGPEAPEETKIPEGEMIQDEAPKLQEPQDPWEAMWGRFIAVELLHPTALCPQTVARQGGELNLQPVFERDGKKPIGVMIEKVDRYRRNPTREFFVPAENIKAYQFGDPNTGLSLTEDRLVAAKAPAAVENDEEVLGVPKPLSTSRRARIAARKRPEEMTDETLEPDEGAIAEMEEIEERIKQARAEEEEYRAIEDELGEEVLGEDDEDEGDVEEP